MYIAYNHVKHVLHCTLHIDIQCTNIAYQSLEVGEGISFVRYLSRGGSVLNVRQVGHAVVDSHSPQSSSRDSLDVGDILQVKNSPINRLFGSHVCCCGHRDGHI